MAAKAKALLNTLRARPPRGFRFEVLRKVRNRLVSLRIVPAGVREKP